MQMCIVCVLICVLEESLNAVMRIAVFNMPIVQRAEHVAIHERLTENDVCMLTRHLFIYGEVQMPQLVVNIPRKLVRVIENILLKSLNNRWYVTRICRGRWGHVF